LGPFDRTTADAVGEPGSRTFFIQARAAGELVTVIVEKEQVQLLASSVLELLEGAALDDVVTDEAEMGLEEPLDARWRAGRLSLAFDQDRDLFLLEMEEFRPDAEDLEPEDVATASGDEEPETIRVWASPAQMLSLSRHGAAVAARGRPTCQFCGNPIDPEGHVCPAMNGHSRPA
jgi:uncharacterized repeat protein (TIGR03847 family)